MNNNNIKQEIQNLRDFKSKVGEIALSDGDAYAFFLGKIKSIETMLANLEDKSGLNADSSEVLREIGSILFDFDSYLSSGNYNGKINSETLSGIEKYKQYRLKVFIETAKVFGNYEEVDIEKVKAMKEKWYEEKKRGSMKKTDPGFVEFQKTHIPFTYSEAEINLAENSIAKLFLSYQIKYAQKYGSVPTESYVDYTDATHYEVALKEALVKKIYSMPEKSDERLRLEMLYMNWDTEKIISNPDYWAAVVGKQVSIPQYVHEEKAESTDAEKLPQDETALSLSQEQVGPNQVALIYLTDDYRVKAKVRTTDEFGRIRSPGFFMRDKNVTNIQFSSGIKELRWTKKGNSKENAFNYSDYKGVHTIYLPDSIEQIEQGFFMGFENLKYIYLPQGCSESLSRKFIPEGVQIVTTPDVGEKPYHKTITDLPERAVILKTRNGKIIKRSLNGYDGIPKKIENQYYVPDVTEMYFTEGTRDFVTEYETNEYEPITYFFTKPRCFENLTKVVFPATMNRIAPEAFKACHNLRIVELPKAIPSISESCFEECESLQKINLESVQSKIYSRAFSGCKSLTDLQFSESLEEIDSSAFCDCDGLTQVKLPKNLLRLGPRVFQDSDYLFKVSIPGSVKEIREEAFKNCFNLSSLEMGEGVEYVGTRTFEGCTALKSLTFPTTLQYLGGNVFKNSGVTDIELKSVNVRKADHTREFPFGVSNLRSITIPQEGWNLIDKSLFVPGISIKMLAKNPNGEVIEIPEDERREFLGLPAESKIDQEGKKENKERER